MAFKEEKEVFISFLKKKGLKNTAQRERILEVFLSEERHLTAEDLCLLIRKKNPEIGFATVYRTMKLLCETGLASEIYLEDNKARYEHKYKHELHEHIVCVKCGRTIELKIPEVKVLAKRVEKKRITEMKIGSPIISSIG